MTMSAYFRSASATREGVFARYSDLVLVAGVVAIVALMVLPLPLWLIDLLVAANIAGHQHQVAVAGDQPLARRRRRAEVGGHAHRGLPEAPRATNVPVGVTAKLAVRRR